MLDIAESIGLGEEADDRVDRLTARRRNQLRRSARGCRGRRHPGRLGRVLATRFAVAALDAAVAGRLGEIVGVRRSQIVEVPLEDALRAPKLVDPELYATAEVFFG
jgi:6-phosphofructokinase 1